MIEGKITEAAASVLGGRSNLITPILKPLYVFVALFFAGNSDYVKDATAKSLINLIAIPAIIVCLLVYLINYFRLFGTEKKSNHGGLRSEDFMGKSFANDANKREYYMKLLQYRMEGKLTQPEADKAWSQLQ